MPRRTKSVAKKATAVSLPKLASGIKGLDEITGGGLPKGRTSLVCGSAGCGKTLLGMEFLVHGARDFNEPGVFVAFEESDRELTSNVASLGFDLEQLKRKKMLLVDYVYIERSEIEETGEYDLEGLFMRLDYAITSIGAKRVVLDTIESLFSGFSNQNILRAELRRLFRWLKDKGVTAIITAERGEGPALTRHGLEEYVADCVIQLDHRVTEQISTRRMRIVKYRGSMHGTNEYPFLIDSDGISVLPITSVGLEHKASTERIPSGIPRLDSMLGGKGYFRGSTILVSGTAGTGKTTFAMSLADAACRRGERCLYLASEESQSQIIRNAKSIGTNLEPHVSKGLLKFNAIRPTSYGLEMHLASVYKMVNEFRPSVVITDPITNMVAVASEHEIKIMLMRLIDYMKSKNITGFCTSLTPGGETYDQTVVGVSSLMDTWIVLTELEYNGERNRGLYILKSRGMAHSNQVREFVISGKGCDLRDVYVGEGVVYAGSSRVIQETKEKMEALTRQQEIGRRQRELDTKRKATEAQIASLRSELVSGEEDLKHIILREKLKEETAAGITAQMSRLRGADVHKKGRKQ